MQRPLAAIRLATVPAFQEDDFRYEEHRSGLMNRFVIPTGAQRSGGTCCLPEPAKSLRFAQDDSLVDETASSVRSGCCRQYLW